MIAPARPAVIVDSRSNLGDTVTRRDYGKSIAQEDNAVVVGESRSNKDRKVVVAPSSKAANRRKESGSETLLDRLQRDDPRYRMDYEH